MTCEHEPDETLRVCVAVGPMEMADVQIGGRGWLPVRALVCRRCGCLFHQPNIPQEPSRDR